MLFSTGHNVIDVDVVKTKELYFGSFSIRQRCQCPVCRNFDESLQSLDADELSFLRELGISPDKCDELWAYEPGSKLGTQRYVVTYPVVGKVIQKSFDTEEWYPFDNGRSVSIVLKDDAVFLKLELELKWSHR